MKSPTRLLLFLKPSFIIAASIITGFVVLISSAFDALPESKKSTSAIFAVSLCLVILLGGWLSAKLAVVRSFVFFDHTPENDARFLGRLICVYGIILGAVFLLSK